MVITPKNSYQKLGYKQTEVGVIPEDWNTEILEGVCVPGGLVRGPFGGSIKKEFFVKDGFRRHAEINYPKRCDMLEEWRHFHKKPNTS
jgi:hypothetical protein